MTESILTETFGDSVNLRILSFFGENPFDQYSITEISEFSGVSRNSVYKYIEIFMEKDYLIREKLGSSYYYQMNRSHRILKLVDKFIDMIGDEILKPEMKKLSNRTSTVIRPGEQAVSMKISQLCGGEA
jgi:DNA-binding IclR family transcriptional regulator